MFKRKHVFLIHGFLESGNETFGELQKFLDKRYVNTYAIDLPGHGADDVKNFRHKQVIEQAEREYEAFCREHGEVILIGFSMGGVIASYLATIRKPSKLILLAPAFQYVHRTRMSKDLYTIFKRTLSTFRPSFGNLFNNDEVMGHVKEIINSEFSEDVVYKKVFSLDDALGIEMLINFMLLVDELKKQIRIDEVSTLIYHGENDELVPIDASLEIYKKIHTENKRLIVLPNCYHRLLQSSMKQELFSEIYQFIKK